MRRVAWGWMGKGDSRGMDSTAVLRGSSLHSNLGTLSAKGKPCIAEPAPLERGCGNCGLHALDGLWPCL